MKIELAREQIIRTGVELLEKGLVARTWGNISCRVDADESSYEGGSFVITPSGRDYNTMKAEDIVEISLSNYKYTSDIEPSMEYKIHGEVYRIKENANFVIHTHPSSASAVSAMGLDAVQLKSDYFGIGNFILCAGYGMAGSMRLYGNVAKALKETAGNAVIMKNHGALCFGETKEEAMLVALNLEKACSEYIRGIGVEPWEKDDWNYEPWIRNSVIDKYMMIRSTLPAYIDDFAQMVGPELAILESCTDEDIAKADAESRPLMVKGKGVYTNGVDKEAMALVIDKNCRAALAALGVKPLDPFRTRYMNKLYTKKYSKLIEE
ncbi:MAG: class II aldolase/adducin family protein [Firmicutes bacterium]|nr:class II aldolase/adducin family protein [Bacillota bacterium]